jgi:hypothetical protein
VWSLKPCVLTRRQRACWLALKARKGGRTPALRGRAWWAGWPVRSAPRWASPLRDPHPHPALPPSRPPGERGRSANWPPTPPDPSSLACEQAEEEPAQRRGVIAARVAARRLPAALPAALLAAGAGVVVRVVLPPSIKRTLPSKRDDLMLKFLSTQSSESSCRPPGGEAQDSAMRPRLEGVVGSRSCLDVDTSAACLGRRVVRVARPPSSGATWVLKDPPAILHSLRAIPTSLSLTHSLPHSVHVCTKFETDSSISCRYMNTYARD